MNQSKKEPAGIGDLIPIISLNNSCSCDQLDHITEMKHLEFVIRPLTNRRGVKGNAEPHQRPTLTITQSCIPTVDSHSEKLLILLVYTHSASCLSYVFLYSCSVIISVNYNFSLAFSKNIQQFPLIRVGYQSFLPSIISH